MKPAKGTTASVERSAALNQSRVQAMILEFRLAPGSGKVSAVICLALHADFEDARNSGLMKCHPATPAGTG
jgi:hypothetical protein